MPRYKAEGYVEENTILREFPVFEARDDEEAKTISKKKFSLVRGLIIWREVLYRK